MTPITRLACEGQEYAATGHEGTGVSGWCGGRPGAADDAGGGADLPLGIRACRHPAFLGLRLAGDQNVLTTVRRPL